MAYLLIIASILLLGASLYEKSEFLIKPEQFQIELICQPVATGLAVIAILTPFRSLLVSVVCLLVGALFLIVGYRARVGRIEDE